MFRRYRHLKHTSFYHELQLSSLSSSPPTGGFVARNDGSWVILGVYFIKEQVYRCFSDRHFKMHQRILKKKVNMIRVIMEMVHTGDMGNSFFVARPFTRFIILYV